MGRQARTGLRGTSYEPSQLTHAPDSWLSHANDRRNLGWQVARVATARRLARAVHAMLRTGEVWQDDLGTREH